MAGPGFVVTHAGVFSAAPVGHETPTSVFAGPSQTAIVQVWAGVPGPCPVEGMATEIVPEPTWLDCRGVVLLPLTFWYWVIQSPLNPKVTFLWYVGVKPLAWMTTFTLIVDPDWAALTDPVEGSWAFRRMPPTVTVIEPVMNACACGTLMAGSASPNMLRLRDVITIFLVCMSSASG